MRMNDETMKQHDINDVTGHSKLNENQATYMKRICAVGGIIERLVLDMEREAFNDFWREEGDKNLRVGIMELKRAVCNPDTY